MSCTIDRIFYNPVENSSRGHPPDPLEISTLQPPHSLGISINHPWEGYGYFLEPHNRWTTSDSSIATFSQITNKLLNICSLTFTMQISTTAHQSSNCMQIITYHVASFRTNHFKILHVRESCIFLISSKYRLKKQNLTCAIYQIIALLYSFALVKLFHNL